MKRGQAERLQEERRQESDVPPAFELESISSGEREYLDATPLERWGPVLFDLVLVLPVLYFMCLWRIGASSFADGDQTIHSLVVQQMYHSGELLHPTFRGQPYFNKPPFKMWLNVIPLTLFGENPWSYRVIDGLCGVGMGLIVFFFARRYFRSRLIAYLSLFALLGCNMFFYGHGVRNAVQDSMMLLLALGALVVGVRFVDEASGRTSRERADESARSWFQAAVIGGLAGLAVLTKNVAGTMPFFILATYGLFSGAALQVLRKRWAQLILILVLTLVPVMLYIGVQGPLIGQVYAKFVTHEIVKRAATGYHHVHQRWYYWKMVFRDNLTVPPVLLIAATLYSLVIFFRVKDRRQLLLLCWAYVPILVYSAARSKLYWYILPAVPGMALLVGQFVGALCRSAQPLIRAAMLGAKGRSGPYRTLSSVPSLLLFIPSMYLLGQNSGQVIKTFSKPGKIHVFDAAVREIRERSGTDGRDITVLGYGRIHLTNSERLHWGMLSYEYLKEGEWSRLVSRVQHDPPPFVIVHKKMFTQLLSVRRAAGYLLLPALYRRQHWIAVVCYDKTLMPSQFVPVTDEIRMAGDGFTPLRGWNYTLVLHGHKLRPTQGDSAAMGVTGDLARSTFGTKISLVYTALNTVARGPVQVEVYLNHRKLADLIAPRAGLKEQELVAPPDAWKFGPNVLSFVLRRANGEPIEVNDQLLLFEKITLSLQEPTAVSLLQWNPPASEAVVLP